MTEILRLGKDTVISEVHSGTIKVVSQIISPEPPKVEPSKHGSLEKTKRLFGENFLGEDAIHIMENKFKTAGIEVKFEIPNLIFPYSEANIEKARQDENRDRSRMIVLRPEWMIIREGRQNVRKQVNILNLRELFKKENRHQGQVISITYNNNPFGSDAVFYDQDWYDDQDFAKQALKPGYAMPTREILDDSRSKNWDEQQTLLESGERRREANETVWDTLLYYASTGKKILESDYDWTQTRTSDGDLVLVGYFGSNGLGLSSWRRSDSDDDLGVCPSR